MNQSIALDSCVVIGIIEKPKVASGLKARLRGKSVKIIISDIVLAEVNRVRGYLPDKIVSKISHILGRIVEISKIDDTDIFNAKQLTKQFQICHNGDNKILSQCQTKNYILVTFDGMLLKTCQFVGVAAFHPLMVGGI